MLLLVGSLMCVGTLFGTVEVSMIAFAEERGSTSGAGLLLAEVIPGFPDCLASERPEPVVFLSSFELSPPDTSLSRRCLPCTLLAIPIYPYHD